MPAANLNGLRLRRVEYDPYDQELEEDEEYDFDFEPDPDQLYVRVRAASRLIASEMSERSESTCWLRDDAHPGLHLARRLSTLRSSTKRRSKSGTLDSGSSTATILSNNMEETSSPCSTSARVSSVFLPLPGLRH